MTCSGTRCDRIKLTLEEEWSEEENPNTRFLASGKERKGQTWSFRSWGCQWALVLLFLTV